MYRELDTEFLTSGKGVSEMLNAGVKRL